MLYNHIMKITKLDNRHNAKRKHEFNYSAKVKFRDFYRLTVLLIDMFGEGINIRWLYQNHKCKWAYCAREYTFYFTEESDLTMMSLLASWE